jgi:hypothetical protein
MCRSIIFSGLASDLSNYLHLFSAWDINRDIMTSYSHNE